jgi:putative phage-type endonuclease
MPRLSTQELVHRQTGLGSSDIVEACGLAPWAGAGPMRLYCEKLGITSADDEQERDDDRESWLEWGHVMEPVIADWYERERGCKLLLGGPIYSTERPNFWATLDRVVIGANKLVEIKNVGSPQLYRHWDTSSPDGVPQYVRAQVTIAMAFHGARETDVVATIGGRPPHVWTVFYDAELADMMIARAVKFWAGVTSRTPPALDATPATRTYLLDKFPSNRERVLLEASAEAESLAMDRIGFAIARTKADLGLRGIDARLMSHIGDSDGLQGNGWKMTWKLDKNGVRRTRFSGKGEED